MPQTLAGYAQLHLSLGDEIAFVYRRGFRTHRWTYKQVGRLACCFARELERRKIGKGDRVMLWGENSAEWVAAFFGCMLRGAVAVPMDKIAAPGFAQRVASDVDAKLYVGSASLAEHAKGIPWIELEGLHDSINDDCGPYAPVEITRDDPAQIIFTSGTTADPRGVVLTHGNILTSVDPIEREIPKYLKYERIFHPIRFLHMLPLSHVFGQTMGMFIPPVIAGTVFFQDSFKPSDVIDTITSKVVLILGRFTLERKTILDALREELRKYNYLPIVFYFDKPASRDLTETVITLAHLSRFIIVDLTDPSSAPHEVATIIPQCVVPVQPLLSLQPLIVDEKEVERREYAMFQDLRRWYSWVLPTFRYQDTADVLASLKEKVIDPAELKVKELVQQK